MTATLVGSVLASAGLMQPATAPSAPLPPAVMSDLEQIEDFTFNFDQPGFYAAVAAVAADAYLPGARREPIAITNWADLLERPRDFRGLPVTVTGTVGRNKTPYLLQRRPSLGPIGQLELHRQDSPIACTVICTEPVQDIGVGAVIEVTGYFVMIRQYYDSRNRPRQAALLVAAGPTRIVSPARGGTGGSAQWPWILGAIVLGVVITIVLLRRAGAAPRHDLRKLQARQPAQTNLAADLESWAAEETELPGPRAPSSSPAERPHDDH